MVEAMFLLTLVYYPDMQDIMSDFEAMSVMSEAISDDVQGRGSGAEDEIVREVYPWGFAIGVGSLGLVVQEEEGIVCEGSLDPGGGSLFVPLMI